VPAEAAYHAGVTSRISAGILLFRRSSSAGEAPSMGRPSGAGTTAGPGTTPGTRIEVLLGHPGGPFHASRDLGSWSIPKGEVEPGEDLEQVARREFEEETGTPPPAVPAISLGTIRQKGGKLVHAWALEGDLDPASAVSNTFAMPWPPGSGTLAEFPEVDRVAWFDPVEARRRIKETQIPLLDRLEEALDPG
jgi:predicted NUDIX family NTP pyrophosphohydrolase